ncbi:MAG: glycosyltransferase [Vicinamibacterales bacterium]
MVPDFSHLAGTPNFMQAGAFDDAFVNVLFVGRTIPNKRLDDVIRFFHAYNRYFNPRSRLLLVGSHAGFERYVSMLQDMVDRLRIANVHFLGHVSNDELAAYYELADVFLCASEHEGFCVPLVESFHMGVPVLAYAAAAVPGTMDGAGILYDTKDPLRVAALIDMVVSNPDMAARIVAGQDAALKRLEAKDFAGTLMRFVDTIHRAPRREHPPVDPDFWAQVTEAEEMDELRPFRPAAFQALPKPGDPATASTAEPGTP